MRALPIASRAVQYGNRSTGVHEIVQLLKPYFFIIKTTMTAVKWCIQHDSHIVNGDRENSNNLTATGH